MTLIAANREGGVTLDVETEINPLHLYRPIDDATHTVLSGGKVDTLKDIGRSETALNLQQTTDSLRFTQGTNGTTGQQFMSGDGTHKMVDVVGTVADWDFTCKLANGDGCTLACIVNVTGSSPFNAVMTTNNTLSGGSSATGFYLFANGTATTRGLVFNGVSGQGAIECVPDAATAGAIPDTYVIIFRYRRSDFIATLSEDRVEGEIRSNGVSLYLNLPRANAFNDSTSPTSVLQVGEQEATTPDVGMVGEIYEIVLDDRWWSDELVRRYEARAVSNYGAGNMIR